MFQSLSRDSWWSNQAGDMPGPSPEGGFNPSVGILGGQTRNPQQREYHHNRFQSLSRDSWWSNVAAAPVAIHPPRVSIPQSGFLVVKLIF